MFGLLCFLFSFPLKNFLKKNNWIILIALAGLIFGIAMEFVQKYFIPGRSCEVTDMFADGIGCLMGWWFSKKYFNWEEKKLLNAAQQL